MLIVKVVKPLVSTNRIPDFEHKHLQVVLDGSTKKVAVDAAVSYTHLRAHETLMNLVCRLLLEKKK